MGEKSALDEAWLGDPATLRKSTVAILGIAVLAWGAHMVQPTIFSDDVWKCTIRGADFGDPLFRHLGGRLEYYGMYAYCMPFLQVSLSLVLATASGLLVARVLGARCFVETVVVAGLYVTFPFFTDWYHFQLSHFSYNVGTLLGFLGLAWARTPRVPRTWRVVGGTLLMLASLYHYQVLFSLLVGLLVASAALTIFEVGPHEPALRSRLRAELLVPLASLATAAACYAASMLWLRGAAPASSRNPVAGYARNRLERMELVDDPDKALRKLQDIAQYLDELLFLDQRNYPTQLKFLFLALLALAFLAVVRRGLDRASNSSWGAVGPVARAVTGGVVCALVLIGLLSPQWMWLPLDGMPLAMRELVAVGLSVSCVGLLALRQTGMARSVALAAAGLLIYGFVVMDNYEHTRRTTANARDMAMVNRIVARVEQQVVKGRDGRPLPVLIVGTQKPLEPALLDARPWQSTMFAGKPQYESFFQDAKVRFVFSHVAAHFVVRHDNGKVNDKGLWKAAQDYAREHDAWPAESSVALLPEGAVVLVLGKQHLEGAVAAHPQTSQAPMLGPVPPLP